MDPSNSKEDHTYSGARDRAIRLIEYLLELSRIQYRVIRDIDDYKSITDYNCILWLNDIPRNSKHCYTHLWGQDGDHDKDDWIDIQKYAEPILDEIPDECREWITEDALHNTEEIPELLASCDIEEEIENPNFSPEDPEAQKYIRITKKRYLLDYPDVAKTWEEFVYEKWFPWADSHRLWEKVRDVYSKLFSIYQLQQKLGESYELVLGLGFLSWLTPGGYRTRRHLIIGKAEISFDPKVGRFIIRPLATGTDLCIEFDMLDIEEQPPGIKQKAEEEIKEANDDPWNRSVIDSILRELSNSFYEHGDGEYYPEIFEKPSRDRIQKKPLTDFSPALFLRERSERGLESALKKIKEEIQNGGEIPHEFLDLCEGGTSKDRDKHELDQEQYLRYDIEYFPKVYNKEQIQIVDKISRNTGVLVQGPPGTGKSHTIANLVCHLLASGQRVLITAKTPRALQVLHNLLPEEIKPLCISLLGSGLDEQKSLENSVRNILVKQEHWSDLSATERIENLKLMLNTLKSKKAEMENRARIIRKGDTEEQFILDGAYSGKLSEIARRIREESSQYDWLDDEISYSQTLPIKIEEIAKIHSIFKARPIKESESDLPRLELSKDLPVPEDVRDILRRGKEARKKMASVEALLKTEIGGILDKIEVGSVEKLRDSISTLISRLDSLDRRQMQWIKKALHDVLEGNNRPYSELLRVLKPKLEGLKEAAEKIGTVEVDILRDISRTKLLEDTKTIKRYLETGGKIRWGPFNPKDVRERKYILRSIKINGTFCRTVDHLKILIEYLSITQTLEYCWNLLKDKIDKSTDQLLLQVGQLEDVHDVLCNIVETSGIFRDAQGYIIQIDGLIQPEWHNRKEIMNFLDICIAVIIRKEFENVCQEWKTCEGLAQAISYARNSHPLVKKAFVLLKETKIEEYSAILEEISNLRRYLGQFLWAKEKLSELEKVAPSIARNLYEYPQNNEWISYIENLEKAWTWKRAKSYLNDYLNKADLSKIERDLIDTEKEIRNIIADLAALLAWKFCFARMGESQRRDLVGWQQAIKRLGKGTGKHAPKYRKDAQYHLNRCKDAIPAWIMPLHRVYETIEAKARIFDVIIVDEASQCGFEALPLTYIGKRILIVGDDKQISPSAVGIERDIIFQKIKDLLSDFEHKDSFYIESSLFDHGRRRFGRNSIILLEHFRCVPEIIHFSNYNWYNSSLIALRQYPPIRLDPLVPMYVPNGFREGKGARALNRPEAELLVKNIVKCLQDEKYNGKTMGVISLQGDAQASLIEDLLLKDVGANEMSSRRLICGNPYSFQGDERDVVFLSMVAAPNELIGVLNKPQDEQRFNVACSRAKDQLWLFHSATRAELNKFCLRWKLLEYFEDPKRRTVMLPGINADELRKLAHSANRSTDKPPKPFGSWFEVDVCLEISSRGYLVIPQYEIANKWIDLVVENDKRRVAVECDGDHWHGIDKYEEDTERQRMLERCNWKFHRIREFEFYAFREKTLEKLWNFLNINLGFEPDQDMNIFAKEIPSKKEPSESTESKDKKEDVQQERLFDSEFLSEKQMDIHEALKMKPIKIKEIIIDILKRRPNFSCVKNQLAEFVLKRMNIRTRSKPRADFHRKILRLLWQLENEGKIVTYKSKNVRVKLV